jgi:hypothetical protein
MHINIKIPIKYFSLSKNVRYQTSECPKTCQFSNSNVELDELFRGKKEGTLGYFLNTSKTTLQH